MTQDKTSAAYYDTVKRAVELPGDPKPCSKSAIKARKRAIREGRLRAPARDEVVRAMQAEPVVEPVEMVEVPASDADLAAELEG